MSILQSRLAGYGRKCGQEWAQTQATEGQLNRLRAFRDGLESEPVYDWDSWFADWHHGSPTMAEALFYVIKPTAKGEGDQAEAFWDSVGGDDGDTEDYDYLRGFAEGATA